MEAALQLDHVRPIADAARSADRLAQAVAGLLVRYSAARFKCAVADVYASDARAGEEASLALDAAIYTLRVSLEFSREDVATLFRCHRKRVTRAVGRIEERRDGDAALDNWLAEIDAAVRGAVS